MEDKLNSIREEINGIQSSKEYQELKLQFPLGILPQNIYSLTPCCQNDARRFVAFTDRLAELRAEREIWIKTIASNANTKQSVNSAIIDGRRILKNVAAKFYEEYEFQPRQKGNPTFDDVLWALGDNSTTYIRPPAPPKIGISTLPIHEKLSKVEWDYLRALNDQVAGAHAVPLTRIDGVTRIFLFEDLNNPDLVKELLVKVKILEKEDKGRDSNELKNVRSRL